MKGTITTSMKVDIINEQPILYLCGETFLYKSVKELKQKIKEIKEIKESRAMRKSKNIEDRYLMANIEGLEYFLDNYKKEGVTIFEPEPWYTTITVEFK